MQITFNGSEIKAVVPYLTYEELAAMAGYEQPTITFCIGKLCGTLMRGGSVVLEDGMIIDAVDTAAA